MVYCLCMALFLVGLYAVAVKRNIVKIALGIIIMDHAVNLFLILVGYRAGGTAPIRRPDMPIGEFLATAVDPLPQALVLTSIVIGLGITALMIALCIRLHQRYGTYDIQEMRRLRG